MALKDFDEERARSIFQQNRRLPEVGRAIQAHACIHGLHPRLLLHVSCDETSRSLSRQMSILELLTLASERRNVILWDWCRYDSGVRKGAQGMIGIPLLGGKLGTPPHFRHFGCRCRLLGCRPYRAELRSLAFILAFSLFFFLSFFLSFVRSSVCPSVRFVLSFCGLCR